MLLFSWALVADINTDHVTVTQGILRGENVPVPLQPTGMKKSDYIFLLNDTLEKYMLHWNSVYHRWPPLWKENADMMLHASKFTFFPLQKRLRALVASRNSDARVTPTTLRLDLSPKAFFIAFAEHMGSATIDMTKIEIVFDDPADLDFVFPPTAEDLAADGTKHPFYNHDVHSRWYSQTFDVTNATDVDPRTGLPLARSAFWRVHGAVIVQFFRRANTLGVVCQWKGSERRISDVDCMDAHWRED